MLIVAQQQMLTDIL